MAARPKRIKVTPGRQQAAVLDAARGGPVVLETEGGHYRLDRVDESDDLWADYDPEKVRAAIAAYGGSVTDVDSEQWIADLYRAREEGSRSADRPE